MTQSDLQALYSHPERAYRSILSVYLNVDQSRPSNQNRGFEQQLKDMIASIRSTIHDTVELERFGRAARPIEDFVLAYEPRARGLLMFFDGLDGFSWRQEVGVPTHNHARWDHELFLQPLANILDQFERYGVVLADRERLRLFTVLYGEIEEAILENVVGSTHLRRVVKELDRLFQGKQIQHLVLAGTPEVTSELRSRLPKRLVALLIGTVNIAVDATAQDVFSATRPIQEEYERSCEMQAVRELANAARNVKIVAGLGRTLKALNSDRVWELIFSEGVSSSGFECAKCAALFSLKRRSCAYCGSSVHPVDDVVERAVDHALRRGARIELVTGDASASLNNLGGIGAFLKTNAVSL